MRRTCQAQRHCSLTFHSVSSLNATFSRKGQWPPSRRLIFLVVIVIAIAAEVACSSSSGSSSGSAAQIAPFQGQGGQNATVNTAFPIALAVEVEDSSNTTVSGAAVTFTAPSSGASGTFANGMASETDMTDSHGVATASTFTANSTVGGPYSVTASVAGVSSPVSFDMSNTAPETLATYAGSSQTGLLNMLFTVNLQAKVTLGVAPVQLTTVMFTAPASGASGMFATTPPSTTAMVNTNAQGIATAPPFTANGTAGAYNVVASSAGAPSVNFALTNATQQPLAAGNYVFSLNGTDVTGNLYFVAGVFTVATGGAITGGEQTFSDASHVASAEPILSTSTMTATGDGNLVIILQTGDSYIGPGGGPSGQGNGQEVLDGAMVSASKFKLIESDTWASGSGEMDLQTSASALCPTPPCGYAFEASGITSSGNAMVIGGVIKVDGGNGTISGIGSVFDADVSNANHTGTTTYLAQTLTSTSAVTAPDALGRVTFNLNSTAGLIGPGVPGIALDGYIIDGSHIRLVENPSNDSFAGIIAGTALGQTGTGGFSGSSITGSSYVVGMNGSDVAHGAFQVAGLFTANSDLSVGGFLNYDDLSVGGTQAPVAITGGSYTVDATGRVTMRGDTSGPSVNLELYLTGDGNATAISLDSTDIVAGFGYQQVAGPFSASNFSGSYAFNTTGADSVNKDELDSVGTVMADGAGTLTGSGTVDLNWILNSGYPVDGLTVSGTFTASSNGVFTGTLTGLDVTSAKTQNGFSYYVIDNTRVMAIETDNAQLMLGILELQQ